MSPFTLRHCSTTWYSGPSEYDGASDDDEGFKVIGAAAAAASERRTDPFFLHERPDRANQVLTRPTPS